MPDISPINNPIIYSVYSQQDNEVLITPGSPQFIVTEGLLKITTENGVPLITEG